MTFAFLAAGRAGGGVTDSVNARLERVKGGTFAGKMQQMCAVIVVAEACAAPVAVRCGRVCQFFASFPSEHPEGKDESRTR